MSSQNFVFRYLVCLLSWQVFSIGQPLVFQFKALPLALITIKDIEVTDITAFQSGKESKATKAQVINLKVFLIT